MTPRRRLSRAQVERDPRREVRPGVSAATWWGDDLALWPQENLAGVLPSDPPVQDAAMFRRELVTGTFANRAEGSVLSVEALREMQRMLTERSVALPRVLMTPRWLERESARFASGPYYPDDLPPRQAITSRDAMLAWYRERAERRALATTGRVLVAWLIGRWRR